MVPASTRLVQASPQRRRNHPPLLQDVNTENRERSCSLFARVQAILSPAHPQGSGTKRSVPPSSPRMFKVPITVRRPSLLVLTSKKFSRSFFIDFFPGADGHNFDVACSEPIDDSSSSHSQTPISFKLLLSAFPQVGFSRISARVARTLRFSTGGRCR